HTVSPFARRAAAVFGHFFTFCSSAQNASMILVHYNGFAWKKQCPPPPLLPAGQRRRKTAANPGPLPGRAAEKAKTPCPKGRTQGIWRYTLGTAPSTVGRCGRAYKKAPQGNLAGGPGVLRTPGRRPPHRNGGARRLSGYAAKSRSDAPTGGATSEPVPLFPA